MDKVDKTEMFEDEEFFDENIDKDDIISKTEGATKDIKKVGEEIKGKAGEIKDKVADKAEEIKGKVAGKTDEIKGKADEVADDIKGKADEVQKKVVVGREELRAKFADGNVDLRETFYGYLDTVRDDIRANRKGFNVQDHSKDKYMLTGSLAEEGYDWWWHSFTGYNKKTGEAKHFFIEYYLMNPGLGGSEVVYGQLPDNKEMGVRPSYMMVKAGSLGKKGVQLHRFFPWDDVTISEADSFEVSADDCLCTENHITGSIKLTKKEAKEHPEYMCDGGSMSWDLYVDKQIAFNVGLGTDKVVRDLARYEMAWHAEGIKTAFGGTVKLGKEEYVVSPQDCYGYADKNWGSNYTIPWIWLSSNDIVSRISGKRLDNTVFVIGGGRPKVGNIEIEGELLGALWLEGKPYEFNFSKPITLPKTQFRVVEGKKKVTWKIIQQTPTVKMYTSIECPKEEMINNNYESPNGYIIHDKLWLGGTGIGYIKLYERSADGLKLDWKMVDYLEVNSCGCEYGE